MKFSEYQQFAMSYARRGLLQEAGHALGLAGEAGEVVDYLKKVIFHGHKLDVDKLTEELGDVLWYIAAIASVYDIELEQVASENLSKLWHRYPNGFDPKRSQERAE